MRKIEVATKRTISELGDKISIIYSIIVDDMAAHGIAGEIENYGVCIYIPELGESACVRGITLSAAAINAFTELISENLVTPCTLHDVAYDWICAE